MLPFGGFRSYNIDGIMLFR